MKHSIMDTNEGQELARLTVHTVIPDQATDTQIVLLKDETSGEVLPIWVGTAEGNAIRLAAEGIAAPRPMSHDLIRGLAEQLDITLSRVVITDVKTNTYYAALHVTAKGTERTVDSRPSDAIALALRMNCPIFVSREVLRDRGGNLQEFLEKLDIKQSGKHEHLGKREHLGRHEV
jgi:bifunctional DNase/RNase